MTAITPKIDRDDTTHDTFLSWVYRMPGLHRDNDSVTAALSGLHGRHICIAVSAYIPVQATVQSSWEKVQDKRARCMDPALQQEGTSLPRRF